MTVVETVKAHLTRRFRKLPRWPALLAGAVLVALGQWLQYVGGLEVLRDFFYGVLADLGLIQPFSVIPIYFDAIVCDYDCDTYQYFLPQRYFGALFTTVAEVWNASGWAGRVFLPFAILTGYFAASELFNAIFGRSDWKVPNVVAASLATPFFASLIALVMQGIAMAMFLLFGAAMSALILIIGLIALPLAIWRAAQSAEAMGHQVQQVADVFKTDPPKSGDASIKEP